MEESGIPDKEISSEKLDGSPTEELKPLSEPSNTSPANGMCEDISAVHSSATSEVEVSPSNRSMAREVGVSRVPVPWGKLTKAIVMDAFKDVHTGLGTLGPPLHTSMNPNVTPIQGHPHRCGKRSKSS